LLPTLCASQFSSKQVKKSLAKQPHLSEHMTRVHLSTPGAWHSITIKQNIFIFEVDIIASSCFCKNYNPVEKTRYMVINK